MDGQAAERHILDWDENDVQNWLSSLGYPQYESQIREHKIQGDSLCELDSEDLKSLGIATIGQRLSILKSIYLVKLAHDVPINEGHYVPPSESPERVENISIEKLHSIVKTQAQRLRALEEDNRNLTTTMQSFFEEFNNIRSSGTDELNNPIRRQPSFQWAQFTKPQKSPTKVDAAESPHPSPRRTEHDISNHSRNGGSSSLPSTSNAAEKSRATPGSGTDIPSSGPAPPKPGRHESSDTLKSFKVSLEDPTWKVLPAALKKYRINNDTWQNYAMFICYGSPSNRIERCLSYDEKPLLLFQKLKDAKKNPVFMLKHIKDIRSPIAVAHQKHAARKASSVISQEAVVTNTTQGHQKTTSTSRPAHRPPKLEVQGTSVSTPPMSTGLSIQPGWPDGSASPAGTDSTREDATLVPGSAATQTSQFPTSSTIVNSTPVGTNSISHDPAKVGPPGNADVGSTNGVSSARETPVPSNGVSYAVAIYPYMAEQDDEFDVVVGDTFVILSRARGWWVVQRDPTGSGIVDTDIVKQGWVPAGCLLETNVPVASAIAEATAAKNGSTSESPPGTPISKTPILPLSIISTSFPGVALMDYSKKGEEELDLVKDDALRVFKRYNHWSYAVKEVGGDRGWVPSWFIGKVSTIGVTPATPTSSVPPPNMSSSNLDDSQAQVSPLSSAFPPVQSRTLI